MIDIIRSRRCFHPQEFQVTEGEEYDICTSCRTCRQFQSLRGTRIPTGDWTPQLLILFFSRRGYNQDVESSFSPLNIGSDLPASVAMSG